MSLLLLAALTASQRNPDPPVEVDVSKMTTLRQVVNNTAWHRQSSASGPTGMTLIVEHSVRSSFRAPRIHYGLHGWAGLDGGISAQWSLIIDGAIHPLTWGGQRKIKLERLEGRTSDPLPEAVVATEGGAIYSVMEVDPGYNYPSATFGSERPVTHIGSGRFSTLPRAMNNSLLGGAPLGIFGLTDPSETRSIAHLGDSMSASGWARYEYERVGMAWSDLSQWAESVPPAGFPEARKPETPVSPYRTVFSAHGVNSVGPSLTAALLRHWFALHDEGVERVAAYTIPPRTNSTDGWTTLGGQTNFYSVENEAARVTHNDWLRDGAPITLATKTAVAPGAAGARIGQEGHPLTFPVFDAADALESSRNSGKWKVDGGGWTADGTHFSALGADRMRQAFASWVDDNL